MGERVVTLDWDEPAVVTMLAALRTCPPAKVIDSLAVVVKVVVESRLTEGSET